MNTFRELRAQRVRDVRTEPQVGCDGSARDSTEVSGMLICCPVPDEAAPARVRQNEVVTRFRIVLCISNGNTGAFFVAKPLPPRSTIKPRRKNS